MPTDIYFAGENVRVRVEEDPGQVAEAFTSARGEALRLTSHGAGDDVYVNPALVAFWSASEPAREPEPIQEPAPPVQEPPPPPERGGVTDIWGQPLRRKPRR